MCEEPEKCFEFVGDTLVSGSTGVEETSPSYCISELDFVESHQQQPVGKTKLQQEQLVQQEQQLEQQSTMQVWQQEAVEQLEASAEQIAEQAVEYLQGSALELTDEATAQLEAAAQHIAMVVAAAQLEATAGKETTTEIMS